MGLSKGIRIVTARGRRLAKEFLKLADDPGNLLDDLAGIVRQVSEHVEQVLPALVEALDHGQPRARALAAWFILYTQSEGPAFIEDERWVVDATTVLSHALRRRTVEDRLWSCFLMALGVLPDWAVPLLRKCLEDKDPRVHTCAASALAVADEGDFWVFQILERALYGTDELLVTVAAQAFARSGMRRKESIATLVSLLGRVSVETQYQVVLSLRELGPTAGASVPKLLQMVKTQDTHPQLRGIAATALGTITKGTTEAIPVLMKAIYEDDWRIVDGVARALVNLGNIPNDAVERLSSLLSSEDVEMRITAATGLAAMKGRAAAAVPALITRAGMESDGRMMFSLADALSAIGNAALPHIFEVIRSGDALRIPTITVALKNMGKDGVAALIEALDTSGELWIHAILIQILREMGSIAAPAVPLLTRMLEETDDEELATYLVTAISATGPAAREAVRPLVQIVMGENDELAWCATQALWRVGPDAIPELEAAQSMADARGQEHIHLALAGIRGKTDKRFARLEKVKDDDLLETFLQIGRVLSKHGELSWPNISKILDEEVGSGRINSDSLCTSTTDLNRKRKELEKRLNIRLTTHKPSGRKGGLTDKARELLPLIGEYLEGKRLRRIDAQ